jgi:hypothetical protein
MEDVLIFSVKIDQDEALKQSAELSKSIQELTAQQKELAASGEGASVAYQENAVQLRTLKKEQSDVNRQLDNSVKAFKAANGSIEQQRANLSVLTQQYNKLSKEERENEQVGGKLAKQIKSLSDELKANESAIGDNRRSVGDYKGGILEATKSLNLFGVDVGGLVDKLKNSKDSIDTARAGFSGFNGVLKASVIGVVITLLTGLIAAFTKFEPLADKVKGVFVALNAAVDVFVERLTRVGRGLTEIVSGNFAEGLDMVRESFDGVGKSMLDASVAAYELNDAMNDLDDRMRAQIVLNAEAKKSVDQLLLQAKNRTLSEQQRLALLEKAGKIERDNFEQNKKLQQDNFNIAIEQARLKTQLSRQEIEELLTNTDRREELEKRIGTLTGDELTKLAQQKAEIISLENETINVEEKIANRRDALIEAESQKRAKAAEERAKEIKALEDAYDKLFEDFDKQNKEDAEKIQKDREDAYNKGLDSLTRLFNRQEIERLKALQQGLITEEEFANQQLASREIQLQSLIDLNKTYFKETSDLEKEAAQNAVEIKKKQTEDEKTLAKSRLDAERQTIDGLKQVAGDAIALAGEQTEAGKALSIASTLIATYEGATKAFTSLSEVPVIGPALGAVAAGLAIANGLANVKRISDIQTNAAAGGGTFYTKGPTMLLVGDNNGGREKVTVEPIASRGKTTVSRNSNLVKMAGGGTLISDGGASISEVTSRVNNQLNLKELIANLPAPIVKVTDIDRVNSNRAKTAKVSQLR